jgi:hypothetical protein
VPRPFSCVAFFVKNQPGFYKAAFCGDIRVFLKDAGIPLKDRGNSYCCRLIGIGYVDWQLSIRSAQGAGDDAFSDIALHQVSTEISRAVLSYNLQHVMKIVRIGLMMQAMGY